MVGEIRRPLLVRFRDVGIDVLGVAGDMEAGRRKRRLLRRARFCEGNVRQAFFGLRLCACDFVRFFFRVSSEEFRTVFSAERISVMSMSVG